MLIDTSKQVSLPQPSMDQVSARMLIPVVATQSGGTVAHVLALAEVVSQHIVSSPGDMIVILLDRVGQYLCDKCSCCHDFLDVNSCCLMCFLFVLILHILAHPCMWSWRVPTVCVCTVEQPPPPLPCLPMWQRSVVSDFTNRFLSLQAIHARFTQVNLLVVTL